MNIKNRLRELLFENEGGDYGYHAGNLAHKSGTLSRNNFMQTLRSQLGTGFFFFGDLSDAEQLAGVKKGDKARADMLKGTTIYKVDFSKYNTFKPRNASEFYDNLVIPMVQALNQLTPEDLEDPDTLEGVLDIADYYRELGVNIDDNTFVSIVKGYLSDMVNKTSISDDLINTRIMKAAGYEGVDLRNTEKDGIVNGKASVGSVLFDLKPNTISEV
jgi:hypothetical protein